MTYGTEMQRLVATPQTEALPGQVPNSAGGNAWAVDNWTRLSRFLILGAETATYYASQTQHRVENLKVVKACVAEDGLRTVKTIVDVSVAGRAPKQDPALAALAVAASLGDLQTRKAAFDAVKLVCRTATHLFTFLSYAKELRGWGRGLRATVAKWYERDDLAYQLIKYRAREGWSHDDALRKSHPYMPVKMDGDVPNAELVRWVTKDVVPNNDLVHAYLLLQSAKSAKEAAEILRDNPNLPREAVPTEHLTAPEVWEALLVKMPMTAMIRNLANMTRAGLLGVGSGSEKRVLEELANSERIQKARIHPIGVLSALLTYAAGHGMRGGNTWTPNTRIVDALDAAFYLSFGNVEPTGKRRMIALDVSGSMGGGLVAGVPGLTPRVASAAMSLITAATGDPYHAVAFTGGGWYGDRGKRNSDDLTPLTISARQRLDDVVKNISGLPFGGTDCALPMTHALDKKLEVDLFEVYTDSETWAGSIHPSEALVKYRNKTGIDAKLVVVGMVSNGFTIADPNDAGMLDVVGFDTAAPQVIHDFAVQQ